MKNVKCPTICHDIKTFFSKHNSFKISHLKRFSLAFKIQKTSTWKNVLVRKFYFINNHYFTKKKTGKLVIKIQFSSQNDFFTTILILTLSPFFKLWSRLTSLWPEQTSPTFFLHVWWNVGWKITCFMWRIFWFAHVHLTFHSTFERSFIHKFKFKIY